MSKDLFFFDFDYTLINENSTLGFIEYCLFQNKERSPSKYVLFCLIRFFYPILRKLHHRLNSKSLLIFLKGFSQDQLNTYGKNYVDDILTEKINSRVYEKLLEAQRSRGTTILITSAVKEVAKHFSEKFEFDICCSSEIDYRENISTGMLKTNLEGDKAPLVAESKKNLAFHTTYFYTDNFEDLSVRDHVDHFIGIANNPSQLVFWKDKKIECINLHQYELTKVTTFIPGAYYFLYRIDFIQFLLHHFLYFVILFYLFGIGLYQIPLFLIGLFGYLSLYEIGYFINDIYSIKLEKNPTKRIKNLKKNDIPLFIISHAVSFILLALAINTWISPDFRTNFVTYITLCIANLLLFILHNMLTPAKRVFTYVPLKLSHIIIPLSAFISLRELLLLTMSLIIFYMPKICRKYYLRHSSGMELSAKEMHAIACSQIILFTVLLALMSFFNVDEYVLLYGGFYLLFEILLMIRTAKSKTL